MIWFEQNEDDGKYSIFHGEHEADIGEVAVCYSQEVAVIIVAALDAKKGLFVDDPKTK